MQCVGQGTIFRLLGILPKITNGTNGERFAIIKRKKEKKGVITKAIFRHLGILPKITDRTNGERCILFRGVCRTLNIKKGE